MSRPPSSLVGAGLIAVLAGCGGAARAAGRAGDVPARGTAPAPLSPAERARADSGRPPYTAEDVRFMAAMIGHHAQAVRMAGWTPARGASPALRVLSERIGVSQRDEIALMQRWLRERRQPAPDADTAGAATHGADGMAGMAGMDHAEHAGMPGMLTAEQLGRLERARGRAYDRLFLTFMIQHHRGALTMVEALFRAPGAGQDDTIFKFASDVQVDQITEIDRMTAMLAALAPGS